jgi:adenylate cyclase
MFRVAVLILNFILLVTILLTIYLFAPKQIEIFDNKLKDTLIQLNLPPEAKTKNRDIVIVDIDEKSLKELGQWPWSRNIVAKMVESLRDYGVGVIGLDIVFAERDSNSPKLKNSICKTADDTALAKAFTTSPVIGGYFFDFENNSSTSSSIQIPIVVVEKGRIREFIPEAKNVKLNIPCLQNSLYSTGFFNHTPDSDGVVRRVPLFVRYQENLYPSLALEMLRVFEGSEAVSIVGDESGVSSILVGSKEIPVDRFGRVLINFRAEGRNFRYFSAVDILKKRVKREDLAGKFILVGTSSIGLADIKPTPVDTLMAGVEIHANLLNNLLNMEMITHPNYTELLDISLIVAMVVIGYILAFWIESWVGAVALLGVILGIFKLLSYIFLVYRLDINLLLPLISLLLTLFTTLLIRYLFANMQVKELKEAFAKKVSTSVMREILNNPAKNVLESKEREITILFSDIRSFTTLSESIKEPKIIVDILNRYFTPMVKSITNRQGTVDKFIGDAIMAYWNAPIDVKLHPDRALSSALEQLELLKGVNQELRLSYPTLYETTLSAINSQVEDKKLKYSEIINIGVGINSGLATVGEMGSVGRSDYTAVGDSVNLASRLEGLCKLYGVSIIISESTKKALKKDYQIRELDLVRVKGKKELIKIYEVLNYEVENKELKRYYTALKAYKDGDFARAYLEFEELEMLNSKSMKLYRVYAQRCRYLIRNYQADWRGVFEFDRK